MPMDGVLDQVMKRVMGGGFLTRAVKDGVKRSLVGHGVTR